MCASQAIPALPEHTHRDAHVLVISVPWPVVALSDNDVSCARLYNGGVYCFEELWLNRSTYDVDLYLPVGIPSPDPDE